MIPYLELEKAVEKWGNKTFFITDMKTEVSYVALLVRVQKLAGAIKSAGISKGDVIAVLLPNCIELVELYLAAGAVGAIFQPLDIRFRGTELRNTLEYSHTKLFAVHTEFAEDVEPALPPELSNKLLVHGRKDGWTPFEQFLDTGTPLTAVPEIDQDKDNAVYLFTSGSTSSIKCVPMTWRQLDYFPHDIIDVVGMGPDDRGISLLPFSHISGPIVVNLCLISGSSYIITQQWKPNTIIDYFEKYKVTWTHTVPPLAGMILKGRPKGRDLSAVRFIALMGTSVPVNMLQALEQTIPSCKAIQGYGLTETNPMLTLLPPDLHESKRGSIGMPLKNVEIRVIDEEGNDVPTGEPGELIVRGPKVFREYVDNPELTKSVILNGWFHTGDVVKCDHEGFYYHLGRRDDVINTGGLKVFPAEVETELLKNSSVVDTVAYGIPDEKRGNIVIAEVVPSQGISVDPLELRKYLLKRLAIYKIPSNINIVESIRRTPAGKPIRQPRS